MQVDLLEVLQRQLAALNIQLLKVRAPFEGLEKFDNGLRNALDPYFDWQQCGQMIWESVPENTLVFGEGTFELRHVFFRLPEEKDTLIIIGPYITGTQTSATTLWTEKNLGAEGAKIVQEYYNAIPVLTGDFPHTLFASVSMFFPKGRLKSVSIKEFIPLNFRPDMSFFTEPSFVQELPATLIEDRYKAENDLLAAVALGDTGTTMQAYQKMRRFKMARRFPDLLQDQKNYAIIFNTLLRKAIERSQIHPYYIDRISSKYALLIDAVADVEELHKLQGDMVLEYCTYVQRYSLKQYSPMVQKVMNHINLNLDSDLTLKSLAAMCFISPSYLSTLFKAETGTTLTDYINTQRIRRAATHLRESDQSIAEISAAVGIMDVNYFAKIFKRTMGTTPTQYRRNL